jgi:uncharacterized phage protein (TIGR01671 family)
MINTREIKFRCWYPFPVGMFIPHTIDFDGKKHHYSTVADGEGTLMQYTGYQDIDGKDIYEGDILERTKPYKSVSEVIFSDGKWKARVGNPNYYKGEPKEYKDLNVAKYFARVIGNIYENPEMLENY